MPSLLLDPQSVQGTQEMLGKEGIQPRFLPTPRAPLGPSALEWVSRSSFSLSGRGAPELLALERQGVNLLGPRDHLLGSCSFRWSGLRIWGTQNHISRVLGRCICLLT